MAESAETEPKFFPRPQLLEAVSWRVAAELIRRHPRRLRAIETHPGGGQSDCLTIIDRRGWDFGHIHLNRWGSAHVGRRFDKPDGDRSYIDGDFWSDYLRSNPRDVLRELERHAGLPDVPKIPASTRTSLSFRFAAACLAPVALGIRRWEWRNRFFDTAAWTSDYREDLFAAFPETASQRAIRLDGDPLSPESRFWFLLRDDEPLLAIETVGNLWRRGGGRLDLSAAYRATNRRLFPIVNEVIGSELG